MISLIIGTNRPDSNSARVARHVAELYAALGEPLHIIDIGQFPPDAFAPTSYAAKSPAVVAASDAILQSRGLVVVTPEYNGSFPCAL